MIRRETLGAVMVILFLCGSAAAAQAQDDLNQGNIGSISGVVYRDVNANGVCTDEDEPGISGIPLQLINRDDDSIINLTSGNEGFYELVSATEGTWQATVNPGSGWRVTSQQTVQVLIVEDEPDVEEVDFCIVEVSATGGAAGTGGSGGEQTQPPVLPESGAPISPALAAVAGAGALFILAGAGLYLYAQKTES